MSGRRGVCLLLTDASGRVTSQVAPAARGRTGQGSGACELLGVSWRKALGGLLRDGSLPRRLPERATWYQARSRGGHAVQVLIAPLSKDAGGGNLILLEGPGERLDTRAHRLMTLGMLALGTAHEMNNLLTLASGWLEFARAGQGEEAEHHEPLRKAAEAIQQLTGLTGSLLDLGRPRADEVAALDVNLLVRQVADLVDYQLEKNGIKLTANIAEEKLVVQGRRAELSQTLLNLIANARQAMPRGGSLQLTTAREGDRAVIQVRDTGCGIPAHVQERVFAPFFSSRKGAGGTGLGLAVCREIAHRHGGELALSSEPGVGTTVALRVPLAREGVPFVGD